MKTEKYIVEIEMPDGDGASPLWVRDVLQNDADIEDEGRWKVSVDNHWKPSEEQLTALDSAKWSFKGNIERYYHYIESLINDLKAL